MASLELKIPPVALVLICAALMWLISRSTPGLHWRIPGQSAISSCVALAGAVISLLGVLAFRRAKTTVNPVKPTSSSALVATGIYRWSRNPMYLGFLLILLGWALRLGHVLAFVLIPAFIGYMNLFQIRPEERALLSIFGSEFKDYRSQVRRWI